MKSLYLECNAGISGDMLVAALLDLGADKEALDKALQSIPAKGFEYKISRVSKAGVDCCDFDVILDEEHTNHDHDMAFLHGNGDAVVHSMSMNIIMTTSMSTNTNIIMSMTMNTSTAMCLMSIIITMSTAVCRRLLRLLMLRI